MSHPLSNSYNLNCDGSGQTPAEIREDPEAAALADAMAASICAQLSLDDCSTVEITGIDRSDISGGRRILLSVGSNLASALTDGGGDAFEDGILTSSELQHQKKFANFGQAVHNSMCKQIGVASCEGTSVKSISTR